MYICNNFLKIQSNDVLAYWMWDPFHFCSDNNNKGLSNVCNIVHVKEIKITIFLLKNKNCLLKNYIFNIKLAYKRTLLSESRGI